MRFSIYRYNPETDAKPRMQDYELELEPVDRMLLDALIRIKAQDDTLSLRRSCWVWVSESRHFLLSPA